MNSHMQMMQICRRAELKMTFLIGKVERITYFKDIKKKSGKPNCTKPIALQPPKREHLEVLIFVYKRLASLRFSLDYTVVNMLQFSKILSHVSSTLNNGKSCLVID